VRQFFDNPLCCSQTGIPARTAEHNSRQAADTTQNPGTPAFQITAHQILPASHGVSHTSICRYALQSAVCSVCQFFGNPLGCSHTGMPARTAEHKNRVSKPHHTRRQHRSAKHILTVRICTLLLPRWPTWHCDVNVGSSVQ
jgi:hypothetical protein